MKEVFSIYGFNYPVTGEQAGGFNINNTKVMKLKVLLLFPL